MKYQPTQDGFVIVLDRGDEIISSLTQWAEQQKILSGFFVGIGAVENTTLAYYDLDLKRYLPREFPDRMELVSLKGNFTFLNGKPFPHVVVSGRDFAAHAGHLMKATVSVTGEIFVTVTGNALTRGPDEATGLNLIQL